MKKFVSIIFANLKGNIGDFAILHAMLIDINKKFPDHIIHVYPNPSLPINQNMLKDFLSHNPPKFKIKPLDCFIPQRKLFFSLFKFFGFLSSAYFSLVNDGSVSIKNKILAKKFNKYDAVFFSGGAHFGSFYYNVMTFSFIKAILANKLPIATYPFSLEKKINTYNSALNKSFFGFFNAALIVRDSHSKAILNNFGIKKVHLQDDIVYSLNQLSKKIAPKKNRNANRVLIVLTGNKNSLYLEVKNFILNNPFLNIEINFLTTCFSEDVHAYEKITKEFSMPLYSPTTWQDAVAEFKSSRFIITNRLHCLILGSFSDSVLIPICNREKIESFVDDHHFPYILESINQINQEMINSLGGPEI
jgi:polysaccharide pyruvyl transferase WcaK-like protein